MLYGVMFRTDELLQNISSGKTDMIHQDAKRLKAVGWYPMGDYQVITFKSFKTAKSLSDKAKKYGFKIATIGEVR